VYERDDSSCHVDGEALALGGEVKEMSLVLASKNTHFDALLRGPSSRGVSSQGLDWKGFVIERHCVEPDERPESVSEGYILGLWCNTVTGEHPNGRGGHVPYTKHPGTITFAPPGIVPAVRQRNRFEIILCALEPEFVGGVENELDQLPTARLPYQTGFHDPTLLQLMRLLEAEARQGGPSGRLYADHLAHALAMRFLLRGRTDNGNASAAVSPLPRHLLQRVLERMHDLVSDLDLQTLAAQSGYSRSHFLGMFEAATGLTPHRYLLQLRVERAQELIRKGSTSLIDIAALCGFSSHAHMSRVFRQLLGATPSQYRRNL
jgi:AraC family transcriptional regulator